jgi:hypothetical protein
MEFRLTYAGLLMGSSSANPRAKHKQEIRQKFHPQLKRLWEAHPGIAAQPAWTRAPVLRNPRDPVPRRLEQLAEENRRCGYRFVPLVVEELRLLCALRVLFLRPGQPGTVLKSADLDARLKTLFDALRMPVDAPELGGYDVPGPDEEPFFCLMQDDKLVTHISVETDMLLEPTTPNAGEHDARLVISVELRPYHVIMGNMNFG